MKGRRPATREFIQKQLEDSKKQKELEAKQLDDLPETSTPPSTPSTPQRKYGAAARMSGTGAVDMTPEFMQRVQGLKPFVDVSDTLPFPFLNLIRPSLPFFIL